MASVVDEQRLAALRLANDRRSQRAALKRDVAAGVVQAASVVSDPPAFAASMAVGDLLLAIPKVGRVKVIKLCKRAGVSPAATIGGLAPGRRAVLVAVLRGER